MKYWVLSFLFLFPQRELHAQTQVQPAQYPSPMKEHIRKHERVQQDTTKGRTIKLENLLSSPVAMYIPEQFKKNAAVDLLIHFHGSAGIVAYAAELYKGNIITVTVNLGSGSGVYSRAFPSGQEFKLMEEALWEEIAKQTGNHKQGKLILTGFSAGYGAIRSILSTERGFEKTNTVILLDGLHSGYIPERKVLAEGGVIDSVLLEPFLQFALKALEKDSGKKFLFTHSEIFPGTFVSTTECAEYLTRKLNLKAEPVLEWGPLGMQQISRVKKGKVEIMGFAGNTAPDHVDHFHGLYYFLNRSLKLR